MPDAKLTEKQQRVLDFVRGHPGCTTNLVGAIHRDGVVASLHHPMFVQGIGYDAALSTLSSLQRRGLVTRGGRPARWRCADA